MKQYYFTLFLCLIFIGAKGQDNFLKNSEETKALSQKTAELFKENKIAESFKELKPFWPLPVNELDGLEQKTIQYLNILEARFGKPTGSIKIKEKTIADIALREVYLVKYKNTAIRLIFTYYKNEKGWILNAFKWDDSFDQEF